MKKTFGLFSILFAAAMTFSACEDQTQPGEETFTVTVTADENGSAAADVTEAKAGQEVTFTATPDEGYLFDRWTVEEGDVVISDFTENPLTVTMPKGNIALSASFVEEKLPHAVTVTAPENGTVTVTDAEGEALTEALSGESVTLTAAPAEGYDFVSWTVTGVDVEDLSSNPLTFVMPDAAVTVSATFEEVVDVIAAIPADPTDEYDYGDWTAVTKAFLAERRDYPKEELNPLTGEKTLSPMWDTNGDGILSDKEAAQVKVFNVNGGFTSTVESDPMYEEEPLQSLAGIEYFTGLEVLDCGNGYAGKTGYGENLDFSKLTNLKYINLSDAPLGYAEFILGDKPDLEYLNLAGTWVWELDLSKYPKLTHLDVEMTDLETLDLSSCPKLTYIGLYQSGITELDITPLETTEPELTFSASKTYTITLREDQREAVAALEPDKVENGTLILQVK